MTSPTASFIRWKDVRYDAIDGAGKEDTIYVRARTYVENVDIRNRLMLIGDCTGVRTADTKILMWMSVV